VGGRGGRRNGDRGGRGRGGKRVSDIFAYFGIYLGAPRRILLYSAACLARSALLWSTLRRALALSVINISRRSETLPSSSSPSSIFGYAAGPTKMQPLFKGERYVPLVYPRETAFALTFIDKLISRTRFFFLQSAAQGRLVSASARSIRSVIPEAQPEVSSNRKRFLVISCGYVDIDMPLIAIS